MPQNDVPWTRPVRIRLQCGLERTFTGAYGALDFLENEWPCVTESATSER
ncbi:hypothetical protein GCM10007919_05410 [Rhizobium indigoferae]|nr:hypothetical protein GCM10007919_05410 [Rhizobium indigoferae]